MQPGAGGLPALRARDPRGGRIHQRAPQHHRDRARAHGGRLRVPAPLGVGAVAVPAHRPRDDHPPGRGVHSHDGPPGNSERHPPHRTPLWDADLVGVLGPRRDRMGPRVLARPRKSGRPTTTGTANSAKPSSTASTTRSSAAGTSPTGPPGTTRNSGRSRVGGWHSEVLGTEPAARVSGGRDRTAASVDPLPGRAESSYRDERPRGDGPGRRNLPR